MTKSIVLEVCREYKVHPVEFFGTGRDRRLVRTRRIALQRLKAAGFSNAAAARAMRRNYSTIQYWMKPEYRESHRAYFRNYWAARRENSGASA